MVKLHSLKILSTITLLLVSMMGYANPTLIATDEDKTTEVYQQISSRLETLPHSNNDVAVVFGMPALKEFLLKPTQQKLIITLFVTRNEFLAEKRSLPENKTIVAIYKDPSPDSMLVVAQAIFGEKSRFSIPYTDALVNFDPLLSKKSALNYLHVKNPRRWLRKVGDVDAIIAIPDPVIFNDSSLKPMSFSLYRRMKGIIGHSQIMVTDFGALASPYISNSDLISQIFSVLSENNHVSRGIYVDNYHVAVNHRLLKTLGFHKITAKSIENSLNKFMTVRAEK